MNTIIVDDVEKALIYFELISQDIEELDIKGRFTRPKEAIEFVKNNQVDVAFLDIQMAQMTGLELAKKLREINPKIWITFITGHTEHALDAFELQADGYILKPFDQDDLLKQVNKMKMYLQKDESPSEIIAKVKTFGHFDLFVNDQVVYFSSAKAKELLALLVNARGGVLTTDQAITYLWEDDCGVSNLQNRFRGVFKILKDTLIQAGVGDIIINNHNKKSIDVKKIQCDYYDLLKLESKAIASFNGEYMFDYTWGEDTLVNIENFLKKENIDIFD